MTTGLPQNQQDLRWPYSETDDAGPAGPGRGRLATDTDSPAAGYPGFGENHPSGPLPVGPMRDPQQRGRLGRKSRGGRDEPGHEDAVAGDADYDWIKYLGEAGRRRNHHGARPRLPVARPIPLIARLLSPVIPAGLLSRLVPVALPRSEAVAVAPGVSCLAGMQPGHRRPKPRRPRPSLRQPLRLRRCAGQQRRPLLIAPGLPIAGRVASLMRPTPTPQAG